jgi:hypothetical protein
MTVTYDTTHPASTQLSPMTRLSCHLCRELTHPIGHSLRPCPYDRNHHVGQHAWQPIDTLLFAGSEVAPQRLPIRPAAEGGRDLIPGPVGGAGFADRQFDGLLGDAPCIGGGLDQLFNRCRHTIKYGIFYGMFQGVSRGARAGSPRLESTRLATTTPVVGCD